MRTPKHPKEGDKNLKIWMRRLNPCGHPSAQMPFATRPNGCGLASLRIQVNSDQQALQECFGLIILLVTN